MRADLDLFCASRNPTSRFSSGTAGEEGGWAWRCIVADCRSKRVHYPGGELGLCICDEHWGKLGEQSRIRLSRALRRERLIQQVWDDETRFAGLYASGRYLKLCTVLFAASEAVDRAWKSVTDDLADAVVISSVSGSVGVGSELPASLPRSDLAEAEWHPSAHELTSFYGEGIRTGKGTSPSGLSTARGEMRVSKVNQGACAGIGSLSRISLSRTICSGGAAGFGACTRLTSRMIINSMKAIMMKLIATVKNWP